MGILGSDPTNTLRVGDFCEVTWKALDCGNAAAHRFYKRDLEVLIIKIKNLTEISDTMLWLIMSPFEAPRFRFDITPIEIVKYGTTKIVPCGWTIRIYETEIGYKDRRGGNNPRLGPAPFAKRPLYIINITYNGNPENR